MVPVTSKPVQEITGWLTLLGSAVATTGESMMKASKFEAHAGQAHNKKWKTSLKVHHSGGWVSTSCTTACMAS